MTARSQSDRHAPYTPELDHCKTVIIRLANPRIFDAPERSRSKIKDCEVIAAGCSDLTPSAHM
jgi:hypothetical protein